MRDDELRRLYWTSQWKRTAKAIIERDGGRCRIGRPGCTEIATQCDHIIAPIDGGPFFDPSNLRAACSSCNSKRGRQQVAARLEAQYRKPVRYPGPSREW